MRLIAFLAAIAVLFCLSDASVAQTVYPGMMTTASLSDQQAPTARGAGLRMLTWPGKVTEAPPPRPSYAPERRVWNPQSAPPPRTEAAAPMPRQAPTSIYDAPPPAYAAAAPAPQSQPMREASASQSGMTRAASPSAGDYEPPHFYSLYREYGQQPDPIPKTEYDPKTGSASVPLNAQFFAATTPDLAQPPPPVPQTTTTTGGRLIQTVPPSPDDNPG